MSKGAVYDDPVCDVMPKQSAMFMTFVDKFLIRGRDTSCAGQESMGGAVDTSPSAQRRGLKQVRIS